MPIKKRHLEGKLPSARSRRVVILTGARQTGKTTLARIKYAGLRYLNLDAPENREFVRSIATPLWGRDVGNCILDEGQKEPVLFEKVKYSFDERQITFTVILGSSQILLLKRIRESLAGRAAIYELWPLMMSEILSQGSDVNVPLLEKLLVPGSWRQVLQRIPSTLLDHDAARHRDAENYLLMWGGMPALLELSDEERWKWLRDYEFTYLERDLADLARLDDLQPFRKFQKLAALRTGKLLNYSEIARDAGVSTDTARRYLEYLALSYQVVLLQPFHRSITSSVVKTPKLYWIDTGIVRHLSGFRSELSGEVYETMVVGEVFKWIRTLQRDVGVYFYRTRHGLEMDLLLETESGMIGLEVKSAESLGSVDIRPMKEIAAGLAKDWRGGVVAYRGNEIRKLSDPEIWAIPSHRLFL